MKKAAKSICSATPALFNCIKEDLGNFEIDLDLIPDFSNEVYCYILHLIDRSLSDMVSMDIRNTIMADLIYKMSNEHEIILNEAGYILTRNVHDIFFDLYNQRQIEYGGYSEDWFFQVALSSAKYAAEALELPANLKYEIALKCSMLLPALFKDILPDINPIFKKALKMKK
jgi:hypothetical protein